MDEINRKRLEWLAEAKPGMDWAEGLFTVANHNGWGDAINQAAQAALDEIKDHERSFDLRWNADMRAIKRWQAAAPGRELTWPDHADLVVWLLEQREDQIKAMVDRFLSWKLPETFNPDGGISFARYEYPAAGRDRVREPVGTNLFTAVEATAMVRHMVEGMLSRPAYPDDLQSKTLLEAHYRDALESLARASAELESIRRWVVSHTAGAPK